MAGLHSTLIQAIYDNDIEVINQLLPRADIKFNDNELLRVAAKTGNLELVEKLIEMGCDISARNWEILDVGVKVVKSLLRLRRVEIPNYNYNCSRNYATWKFFFPYAEENAPQKSALLITSTKKKEVLNYLLLQAVGERQDLALILVAYCDPTYVSTADLIPRAVASSAIKVVRALMRAAAETDPFKINHALQKAAKLGDRNMMKLLIPYLEEHQYDNDIVLNVTRNGHYKALRFLRTIGMKKWNALGVVNDLASARLLFYPGDHSNCIFNDLTPKKEAYSIVKFLAKAAASVTEIIRGYWVLREASSTQLLKLLLPYTNFEVKSLLSSMIRDQKYSLIRTLVVLGGSLKCEESSNRFLLEEIASAANVKITRLLMPMLNHPKYNYLALQILVENGKIQLVKFFLPLCDLSADNCYVVKSALLHNSSAMKLFLPYLSSAVMEELERFTSSKKINNRTLNVFLSSF